MMRKALRAAGRCLAAASLWGLVGVLGLLTVPGSAAASGETGAEATPSGATLYRQYCGSCHGHDGSSRTPLAELFRAPPPDLTRIAERRGGWFPDALVREIIDGRFAAHGAREMPVWGDTLTQLQIISITEHLNTLQVRR